MITYSKIHKNAMASLRGEDTERIEKLFILPKENFEAVDFTSMDVVKEDSSMLPKFIEGEKYSLQGTSCDGFDMPSKIYELVGVIDEFYGIKVDYVIMKQVEGEKNQIFSFSKNDCAQLGIEYQDGLQPFPKGMHWKRVKEKIEFKKDDLSTTPRSEVDNTIRHILLRLDGFKDYSDGYVMSPSGKLIKEELFEKSFRVINNEPIVYGNGFVLKDKTKLKTKLVYPNGLLYNHGNFISKEDTVYVLISLKLTPTNTNKCIDDGYGVEAKYFENIKPQDLFTIAWDEFGSLTIEEFEKAKELKKKKALEKAKKLEEEHKKKIEVQEKNRNESIEHLKRIKSIPFPQMPNTQISFDSVANVDFYTDLIGGYLKQVDKTVSTLDKNLKMLRIRNRNGMMVDDMFDYVLNEIFT